MEAEERAALVARHTAELLTAEELSAVFAEEAHPRAYIGFEPSGRLTIGQLVTAHKMRELQQAGCRLTVLLADWHAWINDKLDGELDRIRAAGRYMRAAFISLGVDAEETEWRWASDLTGRSEYWARVVRIAKATSLARTKRAMTILGRGEEEANLDTAKLFYPAMQAADIFELPARIAYSGLDQRRAHVLAREVAHKYGWPAPVAVHTPLISSLRGGGRMDPDSGTQGAKMSKSDPGTSISIPASAEEIRLRLAGAFCPPKVAEGNPVVEIVEHIVFPWLGELEIVRRPEHGGPMRFGAAEEFLSGWSEGRIHPQDLKAATATALDAILAPSRSWFDAHPEALTAFEAGAEETGPKGLPHG